MIREKNNIVARAIENLLRLYIVNKERLTVEALELESMTLIQVQVDLPDHKKVIGKAGRNVQALMMIVRQIRARLGVPVEIEVIDPVPVYGAEHPEKPDTIEEAEAVLIELLELMMGKVIPVERTVTGETVIWAIRFPAGMIMHEPVQDALKALMALCGRKSNRRYYLDITV